MKFVDLLITLIYPRRCPVCDEIVEVADGLEHKVCVDCMPKLRYIVSPRCFRCGKGVESQEAEYCFDCSRQEHQYHSGRALYEYSSVVDSIYRFKYGKRQEYAEFYGEEIARYLQPFIEYVKPEGFIPVPLHRKKQKKRGYNQAELLAYEISKHTDIPVYGNIVKRTKNTLPLKKLNPKERQNNLKKAFNIIENDVKLNRVIIIDDIYTTGSTVDEMAAVLQKHGVKEVYFIALACGAGL